MREPEQSGGISPAVEAPWPSRGTMPKADPPAERRRRQTNRLSTSLETRNPRSLKATRSAWRSRTPSESQPS
jgi:hypothetical protein